jgi:hypothetical protein
MFLFPFRYKTESGSYDSLYDLNDLSKVRIVNILDESGKLVNRLESLPNISDIDSKFEKYSVYLDEQGYTMDYRNKYKEHLKTGEYLTVVRSNRHDRCALTNTSDVTSFYNYETNMAKGVSFGMALIEKILVRAAGSDKMGSAYYPRITLLQEVGSAISELGGRDLNHYYDYSVNSSTYANPNYANEYDKYGHAAGSVTININVGGRKIDPYSTKPVQFTIPDAWGGHLIGDVTFEIDAASPTSHSKPIFKGQSGMMDFGIYFKKYSDIVEKYDDNGLNGTNFSYAPKLLKFATSSVGYVGTLDYYAAVTEIGADLGLPKWSGGRGDRFYDLGIGAVLKELGRFNTHYEGAEVKFDIGHEDFLKFNVSGSFFKMEDYLLGDKIYQLPTINVTVSSMNAAYPLAKLSNFLQSSDEVNEDVAKLIDFSRSNPAAGLFFYEDFNNKLLTGEKRDFTNTQIYQEAREADFDIMGEKIADYEGSKWTFKQASNLMSKVSYELNFVSYLTPYYKYFDRGDAVERRFSPFNPDFIAGSELTFLDNRVKVTNGNLTMILSYKTAKDVQLSLACMNDVFIHLVDDQLSDFTDFSTALLARQTELMEAFELSVSEIDEAKRRYTQNRYSVEAMAYYLSGSEAASYKDIEGNIVLDLANEAPAPVAYADLTPSRIMKNDHIRKPSIIGEDAWIRFLTSTLGCHGKQMALIARGLIRYGRLNGKEVGF